MSRRKWFAEMTTADSHRPWASRPQPAVASVPQAAQPGVLVVRGWRFVAGRRKRFRPGVVLDAIPGASVRRVRSEPRTGPVPCIVTTRPLAAHPRVGPNRGGRGGCVVRGYRRASGGRFDLGRRHEIRSVDRVPHPPSPDGYSGVRRPARELRRGEESSSGHPDSSRRLFHCHGGNNTHCAGSVNG